MMSMVHARRLSWPSLQ